MGASPRHLNSSRGLADLTVGIAAFPSHPTSSTVSNADIERNSVAGNSHTNSSGNIQPQQLLKPVWQDKEIDHSDIARYCAVLMLCPEGHCCISMFAYNGAGPGGGGHSAVNDAFNEPQLRAIVNLQKATLVRFI